MKDEKDEFFEKRMKMWKMRDEMINAMDLKELRAFVKGYMMGERMARRRRWGEWRREQQQQCGCGGGCGCEKEG